MKKVLILIISSILITFATRAQVLAMVDNSYEETLVDAYPNALTDISAINEIRLHLLNDVDLQQVFNYHVDNGVARVQMTIDKKGHISDIQIIENLSIDHDRQIIKSLKKMGKVTPIKLEGKIVKQKVVLPVYFE